MELLIRIRQFVSSCRHDLLLLSLVGWCQDLSLQLELMVVPDCSVWFFLADVSDIRGPHPFVLLHLVFDVLSLCFLLVLVGCPREVHLVQ